MGSFARGVNGDRCPWTATPVTLAEAGASCPFDTKPAEKSE
jgi:hypothetical protein